MRSEPTEAFATRLSADEAELVEASLEELGGTRSEFVRRAVRYYMTENPDHIAVLGPKDFTGKVIAELEKE